MSWAVGYDSEWDRDIGYGVPAYCDHPDCNNKIDRGLSYVCGGEPYGGERGCGLYFCSEHLYLHARLPQLCERCSPPRRKPFSPKPDHPLWINHKLNDPTWQRWCEENPEAVEKMKAEQQETAEKTGFVLCSPYGLITLDNMGKYYNGYPVVLPSDQPIDRGKGQLLGVTESHRIPEHWIEAVKRETCQCF